MILASHEDRYEAQRQAIVVINTLNELDESWIGSQTDIINALKSIWHADLHKVCVQVEFLELMTKSKSEINIEFFLDFRVVSRTSYAIYGIWLLKFVYIISHSTPMISISCLCC